jgi:uncharacterized protein YciI
LLDDRRLFLGFSRARILLSRRVRAFLLAAFQNDPSSLPTVSLSFWANVGSIAGFLAKLLTWFWAHRSRRYYLLVGRVPNHIERLRQSTNRPAILNSGPDLDRSEILRALKQVREAAESIRRNVSWTERRDFANLVNQIRRIERANSLDPTVIDEIWAEGEALADRADALVQDRKFTRGS